MAFLSVIVYKQNCILTAKTIISINFGIGISDPFTIIYYQHIFVSSRFQLHFTGPNAISVRVFQFISTRIPAIKISSYGDLICIDAGYGEGNLNLLSNGFLLVRLSRQSGKIDKKVKAKNTNIAVIAAAPAKRKESCGIVTCFLSRSIQLD